MLVCKERLATLPLDAIGLDPIDHTHAMSRGRSGHRPSSAVPPSRQASIGQGFTSPSLGKSGANNLFSMGNFSTMPVGTGSKLSSKERYANSVTVTLLLLVGRLECNSWAKFQDGMPSSGFTGFERINMFASSSELLSHSDIH
jgi:hypothetical protein